MEGASWRHSVPRASCAPGKQGETGFVLSVYEVGFKSLLCPPATSTRFSTCRRGEIAVTSCPGPGTEPSPRDDVTRDGGTCLPLLPLLLERGGRRGLSGLGWPGCEDTREATGRQGRPRVLPHGPRGQEAEDSISRGGGEGAFRASVAVRPVPASTEASNLVQCTASQLCVWRWGVTVCRDMGFNTLIHSTSAS